MNKISVIMSVYNGERYLKKSIESILSQTFSDFEFLIVDDFSTDNSLNILKEYEQKDSRIRIIKNEYNLGLTKSLNKAIKKSKGEYLARMDVDDISLPQRFEKQVKFLDENRDYGVVGAWAKVIDEEGCIIKELNYKETTDQEIRKNLIKRNILIHPVVLIRRSVLQDVGMYDENFKFAQDYDLWFRIAKVSKMENLPEFLIKYRLLKKSITASKNKEQTICAIRARWRAIKSGLYSPLKMVYFYRPVLSILLPQKLKELYK